MVGVAARRRGLAVLATVTGMMGVLLLAAPAASAHAVLESSSPTAGQLLPSSEAVSAVELRFDEPVEASLGAIDVVSAEGARVDTAAVHHPGGAGNRVGVSLRDHLPLGSYLVLWRVVSADSHPVHGSFTFALGHAGPVPAASTASAGRSLGVAVGVARFAGYAGLLLLVGTVAFLVLCLQGGWEQGASRRLVLLALGFTGTATVVGFAVQAAFDVGAGWSGVVDGVTLQALAGTRLGHAHLARLVVLGLIGATLHRSRRPARPVIVLLAVEMLAVLLTVAVEGHSGRSILPMAVDVTHLAAAGTWLGGLVALSVLVLPAHRRAGRDVERGEGAASTGLPVAPISPPRGARTRVAVLDRPAIQVPSWAPVRRFSTVALCCVTLVVLTGVLHALRQVPELGALTATSYGRLLLVKIGLVTLVLGAAAVSRTALSRRHESGAAGAVLLTRSVAAETLLLAAVVAVTSALIATTPATASYRPTQERTVTAGPVSVQLTAVPSGARTVDVHLYIFGSDGLPADVQDIYAEAAPRSGGSGPVIVQLLHAGTGHFLAGHVLLPEAGTWTLTLTVRTGEFDAYAATTALTIR